MPSLSEAYSNGDPALAQCLGGRPEAVWTRTPEVRPWAQGIPAAMEAYNVRLGLERAIIGDEPVVVTGQQPGIFTGPLYTIYKAITCIGLARQLSAQYGRTVLPIFWVGSEDHDFDEARTVHALTKEHRALQLTYQPQMDVAGLPMHRVPVERSLHELSDLLAREMPGSEYSGNMTALLHDTLDDADSLADWCARLLAALFRDTELVIFAPHLPEARAAAREVMRQAIQHPRETTRLLETGGAQLTHLGYPPQVVKSPEECAFFILQEGRRRKVIHDGEVFVLPEEDTRYTTPELLERLEKRPEDFSPNVALRCIVQQTLFPTLAYVAGPGEIAYWAQMKAVFAWYGLPMPVVYPRIRARISNIKVNRLRAELGINNGNLEQPQEALLAEALRNMVTSPALDIIKAYRERLSSIALEMARDLKTTAHAETQQAAEKFAGNLSQRLDEFIRRESRADEAQVAAVRARVTRVCTTLAPGRKPQERVYTVFSFLFQQGLGLIPRLVEELDIRDFGMQEFEL